MGGAWAGRPEDRRFYVDDTKLERMIADWQIPITDVVAEVERMLNREAHAAEYYRIDGNAYYEGHPWYRFVDSGNAAYLGWFPGDRAKLMSRQERVAMERAKGPKRFDRGSRSDSDEG